MINIGKKVFIQRGESFRLGLLLTREYGGSEVPYFINNIDRITSVDTYRAEVLKNYYLLLQVRNTEYYEKDKSSVYNYWLPAISDKVLTTGKCIKGEIIPYCNSVPKTHDTNPMYVLGEASFAASAGDLYVDDSDARNHWQFTGVTFNFFTHDTERFNQGTWWYDLRLVKGIPTLTFLKDRYKSLILSDINKRDNIHTQRDFEMYGNSPKWLYDKICSIQPSFRNSITYCRPLVSYNTVDRISFPEKFIVR